MIASLLERVLVGYALGAILGLVASVLESRLLGFPLRTQALAAYSFVGGVLASGTRIVLGFALPSAKAQTGALAAAGAFASLHLHFVNVRLLPGDHYLSPKSLTMDALVALAVGAPLIAASRASWVGGVRARWGRESAALGAALLLGGIGILAAGWPASPSDPVRREDGPNLLLVVLDSARRDHLGLHGYTRPTSPSLDSLAQTARVYEQALSGSSWTVPAVAQMLRTAGCPSTAGGVKGGGSSTRGRG